MPTYKLIASTTVTSGGAANIEFTSIPATYTDLKVVISGRSTATGDPTSYIDMLINSDTGAYYDQINVSELLNISVSNQSWLNQSTWYVYQNNTDGAAASYFSNIEIYIPNYGSTNPKSITSDGVAESSSGSSRVIGLAAGLYHPSSNTAITTLKFTPSSGSFKQYSTAYLYGISNA